MTAAQQKAREAFRKRTKEIQPIIKEIKRNNPNMKHQTAVSRANAIYKKGEAVSGLGKPRTMKNKKDSKKGVLSLALILGGVGTAAYFGYKAFKDKTLLPYQNGGSTTTPSGETTTPASTSVNVGSGLTVGARGEEVKKLQRGLIAMGSEPEEWIRNTSVDANGQVDGIWGNGTTQALIAAGYSGTSLSADNVAQVQAGIPKQLSNLSGIGLPLN